MPGWRSSWKKAGKRLVAALCNKEKEKYIEISLAGASSDGRKVFAQGRCRLKGKLTSI